MKQAQSARTLPSHAVDSLLTELKKALGELYGSRLQSLLLYGSYARGTPSPTSHIDVAAVLDDFERPWPEIDRTGLLVASLSLKYGVTISLIPIRWSDLERDRTLLARSVHREGIAVG